MIIIRNILLSMLLLTAGLPAQDKTAVDAEYFG